MSRITENWSLSTKFIMPIVSCVALLSVMGLWVNIKNLEDSSKEQVTVAKEALSTEQKIAEQNAMQALIKKADIIGKFMARTAPDLIVSYDFTSLKSYQEIAAADKDIAYAAYLKPSGDAMTEYKKPENVENIFEKQYPVELDGDNIGAVLLGVSKSSVTNSINESTSRIESAIENVNHNSKSAINTSAVTLAVIALVTIIAVSLVIYILFKFVVITPIEETKHRINDLTEGGGDLSLRLPVTAHDEIGKLRKSVNIFLDELHRIISSVVKEVNVLTRSADELRESGNQLSIASDSQRLQASQVATAINEMTSTVHEVSRNAANAAEATDNAANQSSIGRNVVSQSVAIIEKLAVEVDNASTVIQSLAEESSNMRTVLDVIKGIADQTNLLALNAAIEAARAGEQGRGFAVVADEVRTLASRTQHSTQEIQQMIERLQSGANNAVEAMRIGREQAQGSVDQAAQAGDALQAISITVDSINSMNTQIATAAEQQTAVAEEINRNAVSINDSCEHTADSATQIAIASDQLSDLAKRLQGLTAQFKL